MLDKYGSNNSGDGKKDGPTITEVSTGNIYELIRSNIVTRGVTEFQTFMTRVIIETC